MKTWIIINTTLHWEVSYGTDGLLIILRLQPNREVKLKYLNVRIKMDKNLFRRGDKLCDKGLVKLSVYVHKQKDRNIMLSLTLSFVIFCNMQSVRWATYLRSWKFRETRIEIIFLIHLEITMQTHDIEMMFKRSEEVGY